MDPRYNADIGGQFLYGAYRVPVLYGGKYNDYRGVTRRVILMFYLLKDI
jgi:hypothetical protein